MSRVRERTRPLLPPRATADGTHRRLLEEALVLFGARGFHGISVREIAEGAGIRASSMYAHLESKEEILLQLLMIGHEEHRDALRKGLLEASAEPVDQIDHLVRAHVTMHATYPLLAAVCNRELHCLSDESRARVQAIRDDSVQVVLDVVRRGIDLGTFKVDDPWLAAAGILAMGLRVAEWWDDDLGYPVATVADHYAKFAIRILTSEEPPL